jgi:hypothetical protein
MALRDQFIIAAAQVCSALITTGHDPDLMDSDFEEVKGGGWIKDKGKFVETTNINHKDNKRKHFKIITDKNWRLSRDAVAIAADILDITEQYELPDEKTEKPNIISIHRTIKDEINEQLPAAVN